MKCLIIYYLFHKRAYTFFGNEIIDKKDLMEYMGEQYKIPKSMRYPILKEMELLKMIQFINRNTIVINPLIFNPEEETSKVYEILKIF